MVVSGYLGVSLRMKMIRRLPILILTCILFVHGCKKSHFHADEMQNPIVNKNVISRHLHVVGDLEVKLVNNKRAPLYAFIGDKLALHNIEVNKVDDHVDIFRALGTERAKKVVIIINTAKLDSLKIKGPKIIKSNSSHPFDLAIDTAESVKVLGKIHVHTLDLRGAGKVHFSKLDSKELKINMTDSIAVTIEGIVHLTRLDMSECSWIRVFWNESEYLKVTGKDKSFAQVAGKVGTLDVNINEGAHFNGKYLRAYTAFVKTYNVARADVHATTLRHAIAYDESNIYTYSGSEFTFDKMISSGTVMKR